jgi:hypothetical protein
MLSEEAAQQSSDLQSSHLGFRMTKTLIYNRRTTKTKESGTTILLTAIYISARLVELLKLGITPGGGAMDGTLERSIGIPENKSPIVAVVRSLEVRSWGEQQRISCEESSEI